MTSEPAITDWSDRPDDPLAFQLLPDGTAGPEAVLQHLAHQIAPCVEGLVQWGDAAQQQLTESENPYPASVYDPAWVIYEGLEKAKAFLLLWRDTAFHTLQLTVRMHLEEVVPAEWTNYWPRAEATLHEAAEITRNHFRDPQSLDPEKTRARHLAAWSLQASPWEVYRAQFNEIVQQCADFVQHGEDIHQLHGQLATIRSAFDHAQQHTLSDLEHLTKSLHDRYQALQDPQSLDAKSDRQKLSIQLEELEGFCRRVASGPGIRDRLANLIDDLPENLTVPISLDQGQVQRREFNLRRGFRQWFEAELIPLFLEIAETRENLYHGAAISLANMRNRLNLLSSEKGNQDLVLLRKDLSGALDHQHQLIDPAEQTIRTLQAEVRQRCLAALDLSDLYHNGRQFLARPLEATLHQLTYQQSRLWDRIGHFFQEQTTRLRSRQRELLREDTLSPAEKLVRYLRTHSLDPAAENYTSIFLTAGYIGDTFQVGHQVERERLEAVYNGWQTGYRGTALITGGRFSGKTLFAESFARQHFTGRTIRLQPGQEIQLDGRKYTPTANLNDALEFIRRHSLHRPALVWIDELESWWNEEVPLSTNVSTLIRFLDQASSRLFFLIATNPDLAQQLQRTHRLFDACQTLIRLEKVGEDELLRAILVRHGATHKTLVDEQGEPFQPRQFRRAVRRIHQQTNGIVGAALYLWALSIRAIEGDRLTLRIPPWQDFPEIVDAQSRPLWRTLLMLRHCNEFRLRRLFGPSFVTHTRHLLQRYIGLGLIYRNPEGWLEIHPSGIPHLVEQIQQTEPITFTESMLPDVDL